MRFSPFERLRGLIFNLVQLCTVRTDNGCLLYVLLSDEMLIFFGICQFEFFQKNKKDNRNFYSILKQAS